MNSKLSKKVNDKIETLCESGCIEITQLLHDAEKGEAIEVLSGFDSTEINQIIDELSQIMSVYERENDTEKDEANKANREDTPPII